MGSDSGGRGEKGAGVCVWRERKREWVPWNVPYLKRETTAVLLVRGEFEQGEAANCGREIMKKGEKSAMRACGHGRKTKLATGRCGIME